MLLLFSLWSVGWGEMLQSFRPLALVLFSAQFKGSTRVQSEGGQEGSFGPVYLRLLRFQKLQTWIYPSSTSVSDTGQSREKEKKKENKNKYTKYRTSFWDMFPCTVLSQGYSSWTPSQPGRALETPPTVTLSSSCKIRQTLLEMNTCSFHPGVIHLCNI